MAKVKNKRNSGLADKVNNKRKTEINKKKLNPFEVHINREKIKVLGKKSKHDRGLPGVSRAKAIQKRKETLGTEMKLMNKTNTFIDRRIGEKNNQLSAEDRMVARFAAERAKQHSKKDIYNLADDEVLTHRGQTLEQIEKFDDPRSDDEEDEDGRKFGGLGDDFVAEGHFGGGMLSKTESKDGAKSHKDLIEQLIAESKKRKAEKQKEKEQTLDLTEKLDSEWKDLQPVVFKKMRVEEKESAIDKLLSKAEKQSFDYDKMMRELRFEKRGTPSDGLKNDEKQAKEEKARLEQLEKERMQRMIGEEVTPAKPKPEARKHRSAEDLDENFELEDEHDFMLSYDKDGKPLVPEEVLKDYSVPNAKPKFNDGISDTSEEEDDDDESDEDGDDNDDDEENDSAAESDESEEATEKTQKKGKGKSKPVNNDDDDDSDDESDEESEKTQKKGKGKPVTNDDGDDSDDESDEESEKTQKKDKSKSKPITNDDGDATNDKLEKTSEKSQAKDQVKTKLEVKEDDDEDSDDDDDSSDDSSDLLNDNTNNKSKAIASDSDCDLDEELMKQLMTSGTKNKDKTETPINTIKQEKVDIKEEVIEVDSEEENQTEKSNKNKEQTVEVKAKVEAEESEEESSISDGDETEKSNKNKEQTVEVREKVVAEESEEEEESSISDDDGSELNLNDFRDLRESDNDSDELDEELIRNTERIGKFFDVSASEGDKLKELLSGKTPAQQSSALQSLIKSYDPSLSENNKDKLSKLFAYMLQYINDIFSNLKEESDVIKAFLVFDRIAPHFYDLAHTNKVSSKKFIVELLKEKYELFKKRQRRIPDMDTLIFFKLISLLYPTSDYRHPVTTPALIFLSEILTFCRFCDPYSISRGIFVTTLVLEYTTLSKRLVPPAINFIRGILYLSANTTVLNPIQVVPPFRLHKDARILNLENDCSKMVVGTKMAAADLTLKELNDDFKIRCLASSMGILKEFFDYFSDIEAQVYLFEPHLRLISRIDLDLYPVKVVCRVNEIANYMKACLEVKTFTPLSREKKRPKALRLYEPDIQEVFTGSKSSKLSREQAESQRLKSKYKKEMKGALREIRRDKAYVASVKIRQKIHSDNVRKEKVKQIYKDASIQQGELNKMKRMK
ncbi:unnamed protein product [Chrysodeixis includens]|uniref:Nucleolar protein 14 homolog n=1 Tax=Chrysodeixis includens TaxID=689277 RepID=A0A9P0BUX0_CHRIL|nr:unnamed protein product [Chrysodeixis includens]